MVHVDFDQIENCDNYSSVPNGTYICQVAEVRVRPGNDGVERWGIRWIVLEGPFAGRTAAWDNLSFASVGLRRTKLILSRLGVPVNGPQEISSSDVEGRRGKVTVYSQERVDPVTQRRIIANRVPFAGVEALTQEESSSVFESSSVQGAEPLSSTQSSSQDEGEDSVPY